MIIPDNRDEFRHFSPPGPQPMFGPAPEALLEGFRRYAESVELHIVSCTHDLLTAPRQLEEHVFLHSLVVPRLGWRSLYAGCVWSIRRCLRSIQPDLVHGHGTERYCALGAAFSGYPNVVSIQGNMRAVAIKLHPPWNSFHAWTARLETLALRKTSGVICNSSYTEAQVGSLAKQTWKIPNALRSWIFQPTTTSRTSTVPRLLNIGSVVSYKRQLELLAWAERLHNTGVRFTLDFVGTARTSETYAQDFLNAIAKAEKAGYARFLGSRERDDLIRELDTADALVHVPTEESFGLVAAEALARNLKLFASKTGGLIDIATGVEGAELFDPNDWDGLTTSVMKWCKSGAPRPQNAAITMRDRYHPTVIAKAHLDLYRSLLST